MRGLVALAVPIVLSGCASAAPVVRSAPAHAESLACAEARAEQMSYTIYGHSARGTGFTAEKREGAGYLGGTVSREILLVDLRPESRSLEVTATAAESITRPSGRQDETLRDVSPATLMDVGAILEACGG